MRVEVYVGIAEPVSAFGEEVAAALAADEAFTVSRGPAEQELARLEAGDRAAVLRFPAAPSVDADGRPEVDLLYDPAAGPNEGIAVAAVRQVLIETAGGELPVAITEEPVQAADISFMDAFVPGILAMSLMNSGIIGLSTAFVNYRERGILRRIKMTPFPLTSFVLARVLSQMVLAVAQSLILVVLAALLFGLHLRGNPLVILLTIVLGALAFLAIGFAISGFARNAEAAASYANLATFPMLFLSGIFFSLENAPAWLLPLTRLLPLPYLVEALRGPMTRGEGLAAIWPDLAVLAAVFVAAMAVAVRFFRWDAQPT
jgi:ABC-2 type transport system permease protein